MLYFSTSVRRNKVEKQTFMPNKKENIRKTYLDFLRLIATYAVVISHICASPWYTLDVHSQTWHIFNVYESITRWGVPIFLMISGTLFLSSDKPLSVIYKKHILRIVTAFLFWSFIYAALAFIQGGSKKGFITSFIGGHYHMWYLFMIAGLYMIVPFIKKIIVDKTLTRYFLGMALVFGVILPQLIKVIYLFSSHAGDFAQGVTAKINMFFVCGFTIYYIGGYVLDSMELSHKTYKIICFAGLFGFIMTIVFNIMTAFYTGNVSDIFNDALAFNVLLESLPVFIICRKKFKIRSIGENTKKALELLSGYSFGVYLIHPLLIEVLRDFLHINVLSFNPVFSVPILSAAIMAVSFAISAMLNKIPYLNRYIV